MGQVPSTAALPQQDTAAASSDAASESTAAVPSQDNQLSPPKRNRGLSAVSEVSQDDDDQGLSPSVSCQDLVSQESVDTFTATPVKASAARAKPTPKTRRLPSKPQLVEAPNLVLVNQEVIPEPEATVTLRLIFDSFASMDTRKVSKNELLQAIEVLGFNIRNDPRLASIAKLAAASAQNMDFEQFVKYARPALSTLRTILGGRVILPEFKDFTKACAGVIENCEHPPRAVAMCSIDGQQAGFGSSSEMVCLQELSYCVTYMLARVSVGKDRVHQEMGREYSAMKSDAIVPNDEGKAFNPMTDLGGFTSCSLISPHLSNSERCQLVEDTVRRMIGGQRVFFNNKLYSFRKERTYREEAMGFLLKERHPELNVEDTVNLFIQAQCMELSLESLSVFASTIANGGVCPITGEVVFAEEVIRDMLAMMYIAGMDLSSGEFAFVVGFPAKNALSGVVMAIIPGVMGICTLEDTSGMRGAEEGSDEPVEYPLQAITCLDFYAEFAFSFPFGVKSVYNNIELKAQSAKLTTGVLTVDHFDPRSTRQVVRADLWHSLLQAIRSNSSVLGDALGSLGTDVFTMTDYFKRTLLHIAAIEGHVTGIIALMELGADSEAKDVFGKTPLDYVDKSNTKVLEAFAIDLDAD